MNTAYVPICLLVLFVLGFVLFYFATFNFGKATNTPTPTIPACSSIFSGCQCSSYLISETGGTQSTCATYDGIPAFTPKTEYCLTLTSTKCTLNSAPSGDYSSGWLLDFSTGMLYSKGSGCLAVFCPDGIYFPVSFCVGTAFEQYCTP